MSNGKVYLVRETLEEKAARAEQRQKRHLGCAESGHTEERESQGLQQKKGTSVVNNAMRLIEDQSEQLRGVLPKTYTDFRDDLLAELLRIFNNSALDDVGGDVIGNIYEYFLNKFAKNIA